MPDYVLVHHGIKGMKWGVRRYQNADGSLTAMGRARQRLHDGYEKHKAKKAAKAESERVKKLMSKPIRKLSADELKERTARTEAEKKLRDVERQSNELVNNAASFTKKLGRKLLDEAAVPALISAGKSVLTKKLEGMLSKALGLDADDTKNTLALLKSIDPSKWTDKQIKEAAKLAEGHDTITKTLGLKTKSDDNVDDGTNTLASLKNVDLSTLTDAQRRDGAKQAEYATSIKKALGAKSDSGSDKKDDSGSKKGSEKKSDSGSEKKSDSGSDKDSASKYHEEIKIPLKTLSEFNRTRIAIADDNLKMSKRRLEEATRQYEKAEREADDWLRKNRHATQVPIDELE